MRTSLEVARQFKISNGSLVQKIENLIKKDKSISEYFRQSKYTAHKNNVYVMYYIKNEGYKLLVDWHLNKEIKKRKKELDNLVNADNLTDYEVLEKSQELDRLIVEKQSMELARG